MLNRWNAERHQKPVTGFEDRVEDAWWELSPGKVIDGTPDDDTLRGSNGDDTIDGAAGADRMIGRGGNDLYYVDNAGDQVRELAGEGNDTVQARISWTLGANIENLDLEGDLSGLSGTGNTLDNFISGDMGSNLLKGLEGNDTIDGGNIVSPSHADTLWGGSGDDTLTAGQRNFSHDVLHGGTGNDKLSVQAGMSRLYGDEGNDLLVAGTGDIDGNADYLYGGVGRDTLQGGNVQDGGDGNDVMKLNNTTSAYGGEGNDRMTGTAGGGWDSGFASGGDGNDKIDLWGMNRLSIEGGEGNDVLAGECIGVLEMDGGVGDDRVSGHQPGGSRDMELLGGEGNDTVNGSSAYGGYSLGGGEGDDSLTASFSGSGFAEIQVSGDDGNDTLSARHGVVTMAGGADADTFVLSAKEILNQDMVYTADFETGMDHIGVAQSTLKVGDGDLQVEGAVTTHGPGGFNAGAELVIVAADIFGDLSLDKAAAAIGQANQDYAAGQSVVFMVDNGVDSWAVYFTSSGADATVSASELSVIARLTGTASTGAEDVVWSA
jgi:Ca2+-binding RTX toxin-like protein